LFQGVMNVYDEPHAQALGCVYTMLFYCECYELFYCKCYELFYCECYELFYDDDVGVSDISGVNKPSHTSSSIPQPSTFDHMLSVSFIDT
jgi:hypothetical protein